MVQPVAQLLSGEDLAPGSDDVILPAQFFAGVSDQRSEPERRLMIAVLEEAIAALLCGAQRAGEGRSAAREAERWFASDARLGPFAFGTICDVLGLDADGVRRTIAGWRERQRVFRRPRLQAGRGRHQVQRPGRRRRAA